MQDTPTGKARHGESGEAVTRRRSQSGDVPFVEREKLIAPFQDVDSRGGVDNPARMLRGWTAAPGDLVFEARIGRYITAPVGLLKILADCSRAVAAIFCEGEDFKGRRGQWSGTGFIVGPNLLLTNNHVINSPEVARSAVVEFNYEVTPESLLSGGVATISAKQAFALDPGRLFVTSPAAGGLDYTFVWIDPGAREVFGSIQMKRASFTVEPGIQAFVIHHPGGQPKVVSLDDTEVVGITTTVLHYTSDTEEGSSGAPVFDPRGRLIALHHASRRQRVELEDGGISEIVNEGIKIAAIAIDIENKVRTNDGDAVHAEAVLREIGGSDTMAGFFGSLGRDVSPSGSAGSVVETYMATDQDVDIGFWGPEPLPGRVPDDAKIDAIAQVIADVNFDAWAFPEVSPALLKALVARIGDKFGDVYGFTLAEKSPARQPAAMIWKESSLECKVASWPGGLEPLLRGRLSSSVLGTDVKRPAKMFDNYPGLFRLCATGSSQGYGFCVAVLPSVAANKNGLLPKLGSRLLARAVRELALSSDVDVIVSGNAVPPLTGDDILAIEGAGASVLGGEDQDGYVSVFKNANSPVEKVFLSPGMRPVGKYKDILSTAPYRTMSAFATNVTDRKPTAIRLSLAREDVRTRQQIFDVDAIIDGLLATAKTGSRRRARA